MSTSYVVLNLMLVGFMWKYATKISIIMGCCVEIFVLIILPQVFSASMIDEKTRLVNFQHTLRLFCQLGFAEISWKQEKNIQCAISVLSSLLHWTVLGLLKRLSTAVQNTWVFIIKIFRLNSQSKIPSKKLSHLRFQDP